MNDIERNKIMEVFNKLVYVGQKEKIAAIEFIKQCGGNIDVGDCISINVYKMSIYANYNSLFYNVHLEYNIESNMLKVLIHDNPTRSTLVEYDIDKFGINSTIPEPLLFEFMRVNEYVVLSNSILHVMNIIDRYSMMVNSKNGLKEINKNYNKLDIFGTD